MCTENQRWQCTFCPEQRDIYNNLVYSAIRKISNPLKKLFLSRIHLLKHPPCIFCHPPRTDPPETPCRHRSPCCSFWRCSGFWWWCDPRRERCLCRVWASWQFSGWRCSHLRRVPPKWYMRQQTEEPSGASKCICACVSGISNQWLSRPALIWALSCVMLARTPVTHPEPSCTPRNYHWKSFSSIRSGRLAWWLFLCCCPDVQWTRRPVAVGGLWPGTQNAPQTPQFKPNFNPITRILFFSGEKSTPSPAI